MYWTDHLGAEELTGNVWGRTMTRSQMVERLAVLRAENAAWGESDDRATEINALEVNIKALERRVVLEAKARREHRGPLVRKFSTGTTHFVNSWDETYCGKVFSWGEASEVGEGRATCLRCQQAGDALKAAGYPVDGGSAARRG